MNGIENIIGRIEADAKKNAEQIITRANHEANEILNSFSEIAKNESHAILEKGKRLADERALRLAGVAQLESRKMNLRAKQQMIDLAFKKALESLRELSGDSYVDVLARLAVSATVSGNEEIILSAEDREKYGKAVVTAANKRLEEKRSNTTTSVGEKLKAAAGKFLGAEGFKLSYETRKIDGGLILREDTLEVDCSFGTIIRLMRDDLAGEVANILFS